MTSAVDWAAAGYGVAGNDEPKTLLDAITELILESGANTRWVFRGAGDSSWPLSSTLYRKLADKLKRTPTEEDVRRSEMYLLKRGRDWQLDLTEAGSIPDMHLLARMQHHGAPTRLLDVTCNPMTALWFACSSHFEREGVLFLLNVTDLITYRSIDWEGPGVNSWGAVSDGLGYLWTHALETSAEQQRPFLVNPTIRDQRMTAQEGLFLSSSTPEDDGQGPIRGLWPPSGQSQLIQRMVWNTAGLGVMNERGEIQDKLPGLTVIALLIPANIKRALLHLLDVTYTKRWETVFPDIAGFSRAVGEGTVPVVPD